MWLPGSFGIAPALSQGDAECLLFSFASIKKKKKKSFDHTTRLRRRSSTPWIYIDKRVFAFLFFLLFVAVPTCDRCAGCRAVSVTNTLSEERVSNDKRGGRFCHLTAAANEQKSQWLLHQRCHFVHVTTWRWLLDFTRENIKTSETKKISLLLLQIFSNFYLFFLDIVVDRQLVSGVFVCYTDNCDIKKTETLISSSGSLLNIESKCSFSTVTVTDALYLTTPQS